MTIDLESVNANIATVQEREAAMREILQVISASRDDDGPVFDTILSNACRLCHAPLAGLVLVNDERTKYELRAAQGAKAEFVEKIRQNPPDLDPERYAVARAIIEQRVVHVEDLAAPDLYGASDSHRLMVNEIEGIRTVLFVPLIWNQKSIGAIGLWRREVRPFSEDEIGLVEGFAAQAVIALENTRQFKALQLRLEREAATKEVLEAIARQHDDEMPVFDAILTRAETLCNAVSSGLFLNDPNKPVLNFVAESGQQKGIFPIGGTIPMDGPIGVARAVREMQVVHQPDMKNDPLYHAGHPMRVKLVDEQGMRAQLAVPLMQNAQAIGVITLNRTVPGPFAPDEIDLVETFAAQAVIAIENVRQFREVQTRLEREQASAEILQIISQSRDDNQPVFEAILDRVARLCGAQAAGLQMLNEAGSHIRLICNWGVSHEVFEPGWEMELEGNPNLLPVAVSECRVISVDDLKDSDLYRDGYAPRVQLVDQEGIRSWLIVPLVQNGVGIGSMTLSRHEVRPFSDDEISLVQTFATQAVIAIENVRQFREVQVRLERETATAEVLGVISQARDDDQRVFETLLEKAVALSDSAHGSIWLVDRDGVWLETVARNEREAAQTAGFQRRRMQDTNSAVATCVREKSVRLIDDLQALPSYSDPNFSNKDWISQSGARSMLLVPLVSEGGGIGMLAMYRDEVRPYTAEHVTLIEGFAAQAVIAIENTRQFREVQERLAREAATAEVLGVISESRSDAQPVFRTILENATRLCDAPHAMLLLRDTTDEHLVLAANNAAQSVFVDRIRETPHRLDNTESYAVRAVQEQRVIHLHDLREVTDATKEVPQVKIALEVEGMRTVLQVPLLQGDRAIGVIALYTTEVAPFTADQIKLVETFAAQAVIAIENTKQLRNLETLNAELGDRVEEQVGEIERMGKLKRFLPSAVADTVVLSGSEDMLKSHRALLGALFCDIRGFTAFCETAEPEETIEVLQTYHKEMGKLINAHGAGVDHRMGDGIMVLFNDPIPCDDPAGDAVRLAIAMRTRMAELGKDWKRLGFRLGFGVGVSMGYGTVGMVGYEGRSDYTASGTAINLASRLCDMAEDGEVLLSIRAAVAVENEFASVSAGEVTLKGIREPVEVFRLTEDSQA